MFDLRIPLHPVLHPAFSPGEQLYQAKTPASPPSSLSFSGGVAHIYTHPALSTQPSTAVLFVLHGYPASAHHVLPVVHGTLGWLAEKAQTDSQAIRRNLLIVTLVSTSNVVPSIWAKQQALLGPSL